jgi:helicase MOV-10
MERDVYVAHPGRGRKCIVKLTQNFRSHPTILRFPNETFYGGDLVAYGPTSVTHAYLKLPFLPRVAAGKFPVVFHAVVGKDEREASSPSFFNVDEVLQVKRYVQQLKDGRGQFRTSECQPLLPALDWIAHMQTVDADIGVIAPYHAQCLKLRAGLRNLADAVKVGSVEEFQGQVSAFSVRP